MLSKLIGCIGFLYKVVQKMAVSLCSFSQFSFPLNFRTASALVLKFGTLLLSCLFSNKLLAIFYILFRSRVIHCFVPKNGPKLTCGRVFQHNYILKPNLKNPEQGFFSPQILLAEATKRKSMARPVFNLKAIELGAFFAFFHLLGPLKWYNISKNVPKHFIFDKLSDKKPFEDGPSGFKIRF